VKPELLRVLQTERRVSAAPRPVSATAYHGTRGEFDAFDGFPVFFTDRRDSAEGYTSSGYGPDRPGTGEPRVVEVGLHFENPAVISSYADPVWRAINRRGQSNKQKSMERLRRLGHDGVVFHQPNGETQYVAFSGDQIRPAVSERRLPTKHRPRAHPRLSRVQRHAQQESLTAVLYDDLSSWSRDATEAGLQLEPYDEGTVAYNRVGAAKVYHGYYPSAGTTGYLDARASYASVATMVSSIREYSMNVRRPLTDSALTSYFKKAGMTVDVDGDTVTVWTDTPATHADALAIAADLGPQVGDIETVEDPKNEGCCGVQFKLVQADYPPTDLDDDMGQEHGNEPRTPEPGVNKESRRRRGSLRRG
jgi:hypothetical protein